MAASTPYSAPRQLEKLEDVDSLAPVRATPLAKQAEANAARLTRMLQLHFQPIWRALRRLGVGVDLADDAAQEVFMVAARKLQSIEPSGERRFLYGVALRVAANHRRARAANRGEHDDLALLEAPSLAPLADEILEEKRLRAVLDQILESLPLKLRTVLVLVELDALTAPEVAQVLGIPVGTVASRLRRARSAFQQAAALAKQRLVDDATRTR